MTWDDCAPRFRWRPSQEHLLELASHVDDRRWHLCAPPAAGKTLIGLELARRLGEPTLVLAPTTAVRDQWRDSTAMFGADPATFTSTDPTRPAPLLVVTYQLLGNPGAANSELLAAARRSWLAEVGADVGPERAAARLAAVEAGDPARAHGDLQRHVRALRRALATGDHVGVDSRLLLGGRTTAMVEQLAHRQIGCIILDECHHLLDWWALVVDALVERLSDDREVAVIGLTATLPDPTGSREKRNYAGLLGPVDAELHLTAMVAEGEVAPWRDGVHLTHLTAPEAAFLDDWAGEFATDLDELLLDPAFVGWSVEQVGVAALDAGDRPETSKGAGSWDDFWDRDPLAAAALARSWAARGLSLPAGFEPPPEARGQDPLDLDDRLALLDAWLHDPTAEVGGSTRRAIAAATARYGVAMTTNGPRWGRSVADLTAARSAAKGTAAADVIAGEAEHRGDRLRALVVVERDRATTPPAAARAVLGEDAGTLAQVLAALCADHRVVDQGVLAVTGRGAWAGAFSADGICAAMNLATADGRWVRSEGCAIPGVVGLVGEGVGWTTSRWLAAAEAALDSGAARVMVATRGLVGEGWDHPPLNVLVDLSEVASRTAATQLRGRAIRLDPGDPGKVASLWDVTVIHPAAPGDHRRLQRRHAHWWGPDGSGGISTGAAKLHPLLTRAELPTADEIELVNTASAARVIDRASTLAAWDAADPGGGATPALVIRPRRRRQVRVRSGRWRWFAGSSAVAGLTAAGTAVGALAVPELWPVAAVAVAVAAVAGREVRGRRLDEGNTIAALGRGVVAGMVALGHSELAAGRVRVEAGATDEWVILIEGVSDDHATAWADAVAETLGPLGTPRWMVVAGGRAWRVPATVGATRASAEAFARAFGDRIAGTRLMRAGTPEATAQVLADARRRPDTIGRRLVWA